MPFARVNTAAVFDNNILPATSLTAGNLIVVQVRTTGTTTAISDTALNTYVQAPCGTNPTVGNTTLTIWYCMNALGDASNVVTASITGGAFHGLLSAQYSTPGTYSLTDAFTSRTTGSGLRTVGRVTIPNGLAILSAQVDATGTTWTPSTGWSSNVQDASTVQILADRIESGEISFPVSVTNSSASECAVGAVVFAEPASTGASGGLTWLWALAGGGASLLKGGIASGSS